MLHDALTITEQVANALEYAHRRDVVHRIVEGSVRVEGNRLRVNVRLIEAATDEDLWAEQYDRNVDDAFETQSEIAGRIVFAVGAALTDAEATAIATAPTDNAEAYRLYLQGEQYRLRPGYLRRDYEIAQQLYEQALELDPGFVLAYASLSSVHGYMYRFRYDPYPSRLESQQTAAEAALRLAPELPQARWAMGMARYEREDYAGALEELTLAAERLPGSAELWGAVAMAHRRLGHLDRSLEVYERVSALDPRNVQMLWDLGGVNLSVLHRYEEAVAVFNRALELAPDLTVAQFYKAADYVYWLGELDSLHNIVERSGEGFGPLGSRDMWRARLALLERNPDVMLASLGTPELVVFQFYVWYQPGLLYAGWAHQLRSDRAAATRAFTGALAQVDSALQELSDDWRLHSSRGLALAGLGRRSDAMREADWLATSKTYADAWLRPWVSEQRAMIFAQAGLVDQALAEIERLLVGPSLFSVHWLRLDPRYDPIREDPRFQVLLETYQE